MGVLWLFIQPLFMIIVYSFVFSVVLKVKIPGVNNAYHFALYLMAAMMPFLAFQEAVQSASNSLFVNRSLLHKSTLPALLLPIVPILVTVITEIIALSMVVIAAYLLMDKISFYLMLIPLLIGVRFLLSVAFGYIVATLSVFIPDLKQGLNLLLTIILFLTPVFYPVEMIPEQYLPYNNWNPFFHLLDAYRSIIISAQPPSFQIVYVSLFAVSMTLLAIIFFQKTIERAKDFV